MWDRIWLYVCSLHVVGWLIMIIILFSLEEMLFCEVQFDVHL